MLVSVAASATAEPPPDPPQRPKARGPRRVSPGTPSPWGIPPELRRPKTRKVMWYLQHQAAQASASLGLTAATRQSAYAHIIPLRSDRELLGSRLFTPGPDPNSPDAITSNSFQLDRGGSASTNLLFGLAFPLSDGDTLSLDANLYARTGNDLLARSFGATMPAGGFLDTFPDPRFNIPTFDPQLFRATWYRQGERHSMRAVAGDYTPVIWSPAEGSRERNFFDLSNMTFRIFEANLTMLAFGTVYPLDRQLGPPRAPVRGADFWMKSGDFEVEVLQARQNTHPSAPFEGWRYREAVGGRVGIDRPGWGLGVSAFQMYGDNISVNGPSVTTVPGGRETLWCVDGSYEIVRGLHGYGVLAQTSLNQNGFRYLDQNQALALGLFLKGWPGKDGDLRVQYHAIDPNYDGLNVRNQVIYPANYTVWFGELRYPFGNNNVSVSARHYQQMVPNLVGPSASFAARDAAFPMSAANTGRGAILDWLASAELEIPRTPLRLYLSWEEVAYHRGATPGLANSATSRTVGQQMAMLRIKATEDLDVHLGVIRFQSGGTVGTFNVTKNLAEVQTVPRLGLTYHPTPDLSAYLMLQQYNYKDRESASGGLNDYSSSQLIFEVQSRWGGEL